MSEEKNNEVIMDESINRAADNEAATENKMDESINRAADNEAATENKNEGGISNGSNAAGSEMNSSPVNDPAPEKKKYGAKGLIRDIIIVVAIVGLIMIFIKPIIVKQTSMLPTLQENNYLFLSRQAYNFGEPHRGDIVVFPHNEGEDEELYIKRVIGLPGDKITIKDGTVYINGKAEDDYYTKDGTTPGSVKNFEVPKGQLYVMGDNRVVSIDSRDPSVGTVKIDDITGKAIFRLWPFSEIGTVK